MRSLIILFLLSLASISANAQQCCYGTQGSGVGGGYYTDQQLRGNLYAGTGWKSVTVTNNGKHLWYVWDTLYTTGDTRNVFLEFYTCSSQDLQLNISSTGSNPDKRNINNHNCGSNPYDEQWTYPTTQNQRLYLWVLGDSSNSTSGTFTLYYRIRCRTNSVPSAYTLNNWRGHVYDRVYGSSAATINYMGAYADEPRVFTKDFGSGQPPVTNNCAMCPDSTRIDNDSFEVAYRMHYYAGPGYYAAVCSTNNNLYVNYVGANSGTGWDILRYTTNGSSYPVKANVHWIDSTAATFGNWIYSTGKDTGSLKADIKVVKMDGDLSFGSNIWKAYIYDSLSATVGGDNGTTKGTYMGTFTDTNKVVGYNFNSAPPAATGEYAGLSMNNVYYHVLMKQRGTFIKGRYKFRMRNAGGGSLGFYNQGGGITQHVFNTSLGYNTDVTSSFYGLNGDTNLIHKFFKYSSNYPVSLNICREPKNPGGIRVNGHALIAGNDTVCIGAPVTLTADTADGTETRWYIKSCQSSTGYIGSGASITVTPDSNTTYYVINRNLSVATNDTANKLDIYSAACASKRLIRVTTPGAPTAPAAQSVCSDTAHTFTFDSVLAGTNGNQIEWSSRSNFDTSYIVSSGSDINVTLNTGVRDTIYFRSRISATGCVSGAVNAIINNKQKPGVPAIATPAYAYSDTTFKFVIPHIVAGNFADKIVWSFDSAFNVSNTIDSGTDISLYVAPGYTDSIWLKGKMSSSGCTSQVVSVQRHNHGISEIRINNCASCGTCDFINNGCFESHYFRSQYTYNANNNFEDVVDCWGIQDVTPDYFHANHPDQFYDIPRAGVTNPQERYQAIASHTFGAGGGNGFIGMWNNYHGIVEAGYTMLNRPLQSSRNYVLSFYVKVSSDETLYPANPGSNNPRKLRLKAELQDGTNTPTQIYETPVNTYFFEYPCRLGCSQPAGYDANGWRLVTHTFTAPSNLSANPQKLIIKGFNWIEDPTLSSCYFDIDDISIKPAQNTVITTYTSNITGNLLNGAIVHFDIEVCNNTSSAATVNFSDNLAANSYNYVSNSNSSHTYSYSGGVLSVNGASIPAGQPCTHFTFDAQYTGSSGCSGIENTALLDFGNYCEPLMDVSSAASSDDFYDLQLVDKSYNVCNWAPGTTLSIGPDIPSGAISEFTYSWTPTTGLSDPTSPNPTVTVNPSIPDEYTLTITSIACATSVAFKARMIKNIDITLNSSGVSCSGNTDGAIYVNESSIVNGTAPYRYLWSTNATTSGITNLGMDIYAVTVTDALGCSASALAGISSPTINFINLTNACTVSSTGSVTAVVSGGIPPYFYTWNASPPNYQAVLSNYPAGNYSVTATMAGCTVSATVTIPTHMDAEVASITQPTCENPLGSFVVKGVNGTSPYSYVWNGLGFLGIGENAEPGSHIITITDNTGNCTASATVVIDEPSMPVSLTPVHICSGASTGAVYVNHGEGVTPYSYLWSNTATSPNLINVAAGTYAVTVSDANGCSGTADATIYQVSSISVSLVNNPIHCSGGNTGNIRSTITGGSGAYSYLWSNTSALRDLSNITSGIYSLTVTDAGGCTASASISVSYSTEPVLQASINTNSILSYCSGASGGNINVDINGGASPFAYQWHNASTATTQDISNAASGVYWLSVTDNYSCTASVSVAVSVNSACCEGDVYSGKNLSFTNITSTQLSSYLGLPVNNGVRILVLPANTRIAFNGTFTINNSIAIVGCSDVLFGPGAKVVVNGGSKLLVASSHLYGGCDKMWEGIEVLTGGTLNLGFGSPAVITEINDALYAVHLRSAAILTSQHTTYRNNFVGIYFDEPALNFPQSNITNYPPLPFTGNLSFVGNLFEGTQTLKPAYTGMNTGPYQPPVSQVATSVKWAWAGIHLVRQNSFTVGAGNKISDRNYFHTIANGIITEACDLTVVNSRFEDIKTTFTGNSYFLKIDDLEFHGNGILSTNFNPTILRFTPKDRYYFPRYFVEIGLGKTNTTSTFNNCQRGIVTDRLNVLRISDNYMLGPVGNLVAVKVRNSNTTHNSMYTAIYENRVDYNNRGIQMLNNTPTAGSYVVNNSIRMIAPNVSGQSYSGIGIEVHGNALPTSFRPKYYGNKDITLDTKAIIGTWFNNSRSFDLYDNTVVCNSPADNLYGMAFSSCRDFTDRLNYIHGNITSGNVTNNPYFPLSPTGMYYAFNSGNNPIVNNVADRTLHQCNRFKDISSGVVFMGLNTNNTFFVTNSFNPNLGSATGFRMNYGLYLHNSASIDPQNRAGNQWFGSDNGTNTDYTYSGKRAMHLGNWSLQQFGVRGSQGSAVWPRIFELNPGINWFIGLTSGTDNDNCDWVPNFNTPSGLEEQDESIINGSLSFESFESELQYLNREALYRKIKYNPAMRDSSALADSFYQALKNTALAKLERVDSVLNAGLAVDSAITAAWASKIAVIDSYTTVIIRTDSARADTAISEESRSGLNNKISRCQKAIDTLRNTVDSAMLDFILAKDTTVKKALQLNTAITATNTIEQNKIAVNEIFLQTVMRDTMPDSVQRAILFAIAGQCPMQGGNAVFIARSMLALGVDTFFMDDELCAISAKKGSEAPIQHFKKQDVVVEDLEVTMFPNPAKDYVMLKINTNEPQLMQLTITDVLGRAIISAKAEFSNGNYQLNTKAIANGLYYLNLFNLETKVFSGKLIILSK